MNAPLDVFQIDPNETDRFLFRTNSLFDALEMLRAYGLGTYLVLSQNTRRKRYYEVEADGGLKFRERE